MAKRKSLSDSGSKKLFTATASRSHVLNSPGKPKRGGNRM